MRLVGSSDRNPSSLSPSTMVCRVEERPKGCRHGWQLEPSGHGFAIGGGRLRSRGGHLGHCINEAPQPNGTWIGWWLKLAHLDFSAQDAIFNPRGKTWFRTYNRPASSRCRQRGLNAPLHESRKPAGESGQQRAIRCWRRKRPHWFLAFRSRGWRKPGFTRGGKQPRSAMAAFR
jgi:hypothetical protein